MMGGRSAACVPIRANIKNKKPPRRAASAFCEIQVWCWLEEDHAASHEHIQILEALRDPVEITGGVAATEEVSIHLEVLPVEPDMHGCRVDFLHDARTPAVDRRVIQEHAVVR